MAKKRGFISPYRTYMFREKDPVIDFVRTHVDDSGETYKSISESSGVSTTTMYNWFHGNTRRPQFATVAGILTSLGVKELNLGSILRHGNGRRSV